MVSVLLGLGAEQKEPPRHSRIEQLIAQRLKRPDDV